MARTFIRQDAQIRESRTYDDTIAPTATAYETDPDNLEDDLNRLRSIANHLATVNSGNWFDAIPTPSSFESGAARGVHALNQDLHDLERKRILRRVSLPGVDIAVGAGANFAVLGSGQLPSDTTAAVGSVATLGTVVAAHGGTFGTHSLAEVAGASAVQPKNLLVIVDGATLDPVLAEDGRRVYGLLQTETATDGHTITDTTTTRAQISFVVRTATGDDLEACPVSDIEGKTVNYAFVRRRALLDLNEDALLGEDFVDAGAAGSSSSDRQEAYNNQGTTAVNLTNNATLDLEGPGLVWQLRDDAEASVFRVVEGSAGGTTTVHVATATDVFDVDAVVNDFVAGVTVRSGGTRPLELGVSDGVIETTAGNLELRAAGELLFDDVNNPAGWSLAGIKLSETADDWTDFETNFGEVSLLEAINAVYTAAQSGGTRTVVQATLTADVAAGSDVNGPGTPHNNTDIDLAPFDQVASFVQSVDVYVNGEYQTKDAASGGGADCYPGGTPAAGDIAFNYALVGTGSKPDQITVIVHGQ